MTESPAPLNSRFFSTGSMKSTTEAPVGSGRTQKWNSHNVNFNADALLARRVNDAVYRAILAHDPDARDRDIKERQLAALSDAALGNSPEYHPLRSALLEVEFIDNEAVDNS